MDFSIVSDAAKQLMSAPAWLLFALAINVIGFVIKAIRVIPNRVIPLLCVVIGAVLFPFVGSVDAIVPPPKHPVVVLVILGIILSFIAWAVHGLVLKRFEKFLPSWVLDAESDTQAVTETNQPTQNENLPPKP